MHIFISQNFFFFQRISAVFVHMKKDMAIKGVLSTESSHNLYLFIFFYFFMQNKIFDSSYSFFLMQKDQFQMINKFSGNFKLAKKTVKRSVFFSTPLLVYTT